jgi:hypothetical protein
VKLPAVAVPAHVAASIPRRTPIDRRIRDP